MQNYQYYMIGIPILVILYIFIYSKFAKKKILEMQKNNDFDKAITDVLNKYLKEGESLKYFIESRWRKTFSACNYYMAITERRLILVKLAKFSGDYRKNMLVVDEEFENISNIIIRETTISEQGNMVIRRFKGKEIKFKVNNKKHLLKIKYAIFCVT